MPENSPTTAAQPSPAGRYGVAAVCLLVGAFILIIAADVVPAKEAKFNAPQWVVGACGIVFMLAAVMILVPPSMRRLQGFLGALLLSLFAAIPAWIAFGAGERKFSGSVSFGIMTATSQPGVSTGRIVFGIAAVLISLIAICAWLRWLRSVFETPASGTSEGNKPQ